MWKIKYIAIQKIANESEHATTYISPLCDRNPSILTDREKRLMYKDIHNIEKYDNILKTMIVEIMLLNQRKIRNSLGATLNKYFSSYMKTSC